MLKHLYNFVVGSKTLPSIQFGFRKELGTCEALFHFNRDFSAAFDSVNHADLIFKQQSLSGFILMF